MRSPLYGSMIVRRETPGALYVVSFRSFSGIAAFWIADSLSYEPV
jgi:hypothetical protein